VKWSIRIEGGGQVKRSAMNRNPLRRARRKQREQREHRRQRGSATLLVPVAVVCLLTLAGIAIDAAIVFAGVREAADAAAAAANDAAARFSEGGYYEAGTVDTYAASELQAQAANALNSRSFALLKNPEVTAQIATSSSGNLSVHTEVSGTVNTFFFKIVPGVRDSYSISVDGDAELRESG
jgi:Flp pilus assembly protein TadG